MLVGVAILASRVLVWSLRNNASVGDASQFVVHHVHDVERALARGGNRGYLGGEQRPPVRVKRHGLVEALGSQQVVAPGVSVVLRGKRACPHGRRLHGLRVERDGNAFNLVGQHDLHRGCASVGTNALELAVGKGEGFH